MSFSGYILRYGVLRYCVSYSVYGVSTLPSYLATLSILSTCLFLPCTTTALLYSALYCSEGPVYLWPPLAYPLLCAGIGLPPIPYSARVNLPLTP